MNRVELKEWSKEKIKDKLWDIWKGILIALAVVLVLSLGLAIIQTIFGEKSTITAVISIVVEIISIPISIGLLAYTMKFVRKEELDNNLIFDFFGDVVKIAATIILMGLIVALGCVCFIVPGIYLAFSYMLVPYLLAERKDLTMTETLRLSRKMMNGHKLDYFILGLSFIGWALLTPFTLGILLVWLYPYMMVANTKFATDIIDNYEEE